MKPKTICKQVKLFNVYVLPYCLAEKGKAYFTIRQVFKYCVKLGVTCVCVLYLLQLHALISLF